MIVAPARDVPGISAKTLGASDLERVEPGHAVDRFHARGMNAALRPEDDQTADDEGERDGRRCEEMPLDGGFRTAGRAPPPA